MRKWGPPLLLTAVLTIVTVGFFLAVRLTPAAATQQAATNDRLLTLLLVVAAIIFGLVVGFFVYSLIAFRRRPGDLKDAGGSKGNYRLEALWTLIPLVVIFAIGVYSTNVLIVNSAPPSGEPELEVKVTGFQWAWTYEYPQFGIISGQLVLPVGRPVLFRLYATDVIHSFFIPEFRVKMDAIPGIENTVRATPTEIGDYRVLCAEVCGTGHAYMASPARVVDAATFEEWVKAQPAAPAAGGEAAVEAKTGPEAGQQYAQQYGCIACHSLDGAQLVGPTWKGLYGSTVTHEDGSTTIADEEYLKEAIVNPAARIVKGYANVMPANYDELLTEQQIADIIEYIKTIR